MLASAEPWMGALPEKLPTRWQEFDPNILSWRPAPVPHAVKVAVVTALTQQIPCRASKKGYKDNLMNYGSSSTSTSLPQSSTNLSAMDLLGCLAFEIKGMPGLMSPCAQALPVDYRFPQSSQRLWPQSRQPYNRVCMRLNSRWQWRCRTNSTSMS